jgi:hypothetical protein
LVVTYIGPENASLYRESQNKLGLISMASVREGNRPTFPLLLALRRVISNANATKALVWLLNDEAL